MHDARELGEFFATAIAAGFFGGLTMEVVLWIVGRGGWAKADMLIALGSLVTRRREGAWLTGAILHVIAAAGFSLIYTYVMVKTGYTDLPQSGALGAGLGFFHGLIVSLALVWVIAEQHPLPEFQDAGLAIGLSHVLGHVAYGVTVGFIVGIAPL